MGARVGTAGAAEGELVAEGDGYVTNFNRFSKPT